MKKLLYLSLLIGIAACDGFDEAIEQGQFEVTVVDTQYCNYVLLEFQEEDIEAVRQITGNDSALYYALNLNKILVHPGQRLRVEIRKLAENEYPACPTFAPTYPLVFLLSLKILS